VSFLRRVRSTSGGAVGLVVGTRLAYWAAVLVALLWEPIRYGFPRYHAYGARSDFVFGAFAQWDVDWFLRIAAHGYDSRQASSFFPLYPALTAALGYVLRSNLVAGVLISLIAAGAAAAGLVRVARAVASPAVAADSVLFLALYPIAFVFTAVYSDALFLALAVWSFAFAFRGRGFAAGVLAALAVLTRPTGIALVPGLAMLLWRGDGGSRRCAPLLLAPAALAAYCIYLHEHFGDAFAFVHSEGSFWLRHVPATGPLGGAWAAVKSGEQGAAELLRHLPPVSGAPSGFGKPEQFAAWNVVQLLVLVAACVLTWTCWQRISRPLAVYSAATILVFLSAPADVVPLVSVPRFLLADFPLFIALADVASRRPGLRTATIAGFAAVGLTAAVAFTRGIWIS
jgi:Mannosyltransferase (PIG-V)